MSSAFVIGQRKFVQNTDFKMEIEKVIMNQ